MEKYFLLAISFSINVIILIIKPLVKKHKKLILRLSVVGMGIASTFFYKAYGQFIDACIIVSISFIIYHLGIKYAIERIKEKI